MPDLEQAAQNLAASVMSVKELSSLKAFLNHALSFGVLCSLCRVYCRYLLRPSGNSEEARGIAAEKQGTCLGIEAKLIAARQAGRRERRRARRRWTS